MLALADAMVVAGLIFSFFGRLPTPPIPPPPPPSPPHAGGERGGGGGEPPHQPCEWEATQRLAQAGLGGTVTLIPNGPLRFEIMYPPEPEEAYKEIPRFARNDRGACLAAQSVWTAFDIATECMRVSTPVSGRLQQEECPTFTRVEVTILVHSTQIHASVRTLDLVALSAGELSEAEFIERVTYHFQR